MSRHPKPLTPWKERDRFSASHLQEVVSVVENIQTVLPDSGGAMAARGIALSIPDQIQYLGVARVSARHVGGDQGDADNPASYIYDIRPQPQLNYTGDDPPMYTDVPVLYRQIGRATPPANETGVPAILISVGVSEEFPDGVALLSGETTGEVMEVAQCEPPEETLNLDRTR